jgi:hypothetical protein
MRANCRRRSCDGKESFSREPRRWGEELRAWLEAERERLRRRLGSALGQLVDDAHRRGSLPEGLSWAEQWIVALPLDQHGHLQLLRILYLVGRNAEARARYAELRSRLGSLELEQLPELVQIGELLERGPVSAPRSPASSAALFTPDLIGRGSALAELDAARRLASEGGGCLVVVEGELGIGKTRLCEEFLRHWSVNPVICSCAGHTLAKAPARWSGVFSARSQPNLPMLPDSREPHRLRSSSLPRSPRRFASVSRE